MNTTSFIIFAAVLLCCLIIALYAFYLEHKEQMLKLGSLKAMMEQDPYPMYTSISDSSKNTSPLSSTSSEYICDDTRTID